jgi:hypothetical protein
VYLAISTVYPALCMVTYDRWTTLPTPAEMVAVALWPWAHALERRRGEGGNGWGRMATAMLFHPGPTQQREKKGEGGTAAE